MLSHDPVQHASFEVLSNANGHPLDIHVKYSGHRETTTFLASLVHGRSTTSGSPCDRLCPTACISAVNSQYAAHNQ